MDKVRLSNMHCWQNELALAIKHGHKDSLLKRHLWTLITYTVLLGVRVAPCFSVTVIQTQRWLVCTPLTTHMPLTHSHT